MSAELRTLTVEELHEALNAECKLAEMDLYADLAALHDDEACPIMRRWYAERYRKFIGVHPDRREEFQLAIEKVRDGGGVPVQEVIDSLQRDSPMNGSCSGSAAAIA